MENLSLQLFQKKTGFKFFFFPHSFCNKQNFLTWISPTWSSQTILKNNFPLFWISSLIKRFFLLCTKEITKVFQESLEISLEKNFLWEILANKICELTINRFSNLLSFLKFIRLGWFVIAQISPFIHSFCVSFWGEPSTSKRIYNSKKEKCLYKIWSSFNINLQNPSSAKQLEPSQNLSSNFKDQNSDSKIWVEAKGTGQRR